MFMFFGELDLKKNAPGGIPPLLIFVDVGILVLLGTFMTFSSAPIARKTASLAAFHLVLHIGLLSFIYKSSVPSEVLFIIILRYVGVFVSYLLIAASFSEPRRYKNLSITNLVYVAFGVLLGGQCYLTAFTPTQQKLLGIFFPPFVTNGYMNMIVPGIAVALGICAFCFINQPTALNKFIFVAFMYSLLIMFPSDFYVKFLTPPLHEWLYYRLLASSAVTVGGLATIMLYGPQCSPRYHLYA